MRQSISGKLSLHQHILPFAFCLHTEICIPFNNGKQFYDPLIPCTMAPLSHLGWQTLQGSQGLQCCFPLPRLLAGTDHRIMAGLSSFKSSPKSIKICPFGQKHRESHLIMSMMSIFTWRLKRLETSCPFESQKSAETPHLLQARRTLESATAVEHYAKRHPNGMPPAGA